MKEVFKTFLSLIILIIISALGYSAWIINKGEFSSQYLEKFINDRFKSDNFYTSISDPSIKFDKEEKRIVVKGSKFEIYTVKDEKVSEFDSLKIHIKIIPLITKRKLITNKLELDNGEINLPEVFSKKLLVNSIQLKGNLIDDKKININSLSASINKDFYKGSAEIDLINLSAQGKLTKLERKKIFQGFDLKSEDMKFFVNKEEFNIEGNAILGNINIFLKGKKNFVNKKEFVSKYNLSGEIDEKGIEESFNLKVDPYLKGKVKFEADYFIQEDNKQKIVTKNDLKNTELDFQIIDLTKDKDIDAKANISYLFFDNKLSEIRVDEYKEGNNELNGAIVFSKEFKFFKNLDLNLLKDDKKLSVKIIKGKKDSKLILNADSFDFSKVANNYLSNDNNKKSFFTDLQPLTIDLKAKEVLLSEKSIFDVEALINYNNKSLNKVDLKAKFDNNKIFNVGFVRKNNVNQLNLDGDYFDFSETLKETFLEKNKEDSFLKKFQPLKINLKAKEILVGEEKYIYDVNGELKYEKELFKEVSLNAKLNDQKNFDLNIKPKKDSRELVINSNDAGLFLKTFDINKSGNEGELVLHGNYDDSKETHPLNASVTIRDMRLVKAPTLAKILNLASIGIVSTLSGEGILINKLKSEFILDDGILNLKKYEAYGPDVGFSNQGFIYLRKDEIDLEGAIIPMLTLNKIFGSIPVLGKILTNERKGIWSFIYTIKGNLEEPDVKVDPIKTITPGFIQKFFSVFKKDEEDKENKEN